VKYAKYAYTLDEDVCVMYYPKEGKWGLYPIQRLCEPQFGKYESLKKKGMACYPMW